MPTYLKYLNHFIGKPNERNYRSAMKTVSLLIPVYNEEQTLKLLVDKINTLIISELNGGGINGRFFL